MERLKLLSYKDLVVSNFKMVVLFVVAFNQV